MGFSNCMNFASPVATGSFKAAFMGVAILLAAPVAAHTVRVDHHGGPVDARYSGNLVVTHKQVGSVAPPGVASALRCTWTARLAVERVANTASGNVIARNFAGDKVAAGSRHGLCESSRVAIAGEVAAHEAKISHHLAMAARQDDRFLRSQLDRLHETASIR